MDLGLYALRFRAKDPIAALSCPIPLLAGQTGAVGYYRLVYPSSINLLWRQFQHRTGRQHPLPASFQRAEHAACQL